MNFNKELVDEILKLGFKITFEYPNTGFGFYLNGLELSYFYRGELKLFLLKNRQEVGRSNVDSIEELHRLIFLIAENI